MQRLHWTLIFIFWVQFVHYELNIRMISKIFTYITRRYVERLKKQRRYTPELFYKVKIFVGFFFCFVFLFICLFICP